MGKISAFIAVVCCFIAQSLGLNIIKPLIPKSRTFMTQSAYNEETTTENIGSSNVPAVIDDDKRTVNWRAAVKSTVKVKEIDRTVEAYMALPASQYSVLAASQVERLSDISFKVTLGKLNFFGNIIIPVMYVDVNVKPEEARSEIVVTRAETIGSPAAESVNGTFSISAVNLVSAGKDSKGRKTLTSDTHLAIDAVIPKSRIPSRVIRSTGNFIIQSSLNVFVATFVRILAMDFKRWSAGSDERSEVEGAKLDFE